MAENDLNIENMEDSLTEVEEEISHAENDAEKFEDESAVESEDAPEDAPVPAPAPAKKAKHAQEVPEYEKNAKTLRRNLTIAIVALVILLIILAILVYMFLMNAQNVSVQQTQNAETEVTQIEGNESHETQDSQKSATVPTLAAALGGKYDDAVTTIGHGAQVASDESKEDDDIGDDGIKRTVKLTLANDAGDSKSGNPTVTLTMDKEDVVKTVSYTASTKVLGYGSMSFQDAILNDKIITRVMSEAGVTIDDSQITLPENQSEYATYTSDGKRVSKEEREFSGEASNCKWSAKLLYDYALSITTDNLQDTVRTISISIS